MYYILNSRTKLVITYDLILISAKKCFTDGSNNQNGLSEMNSFTEKKIDY